MAVLVKENKISITRSPESQLSLLLIESLARRILSKDYYTMLVILTCDLMPMCSRLSIKAFGESGHRKPFVGTAGQYLKASFT